MPKWICKVNWSGGQFRITIPKGLVEAMKWQDAAHVMLESTGKKGVLVWRLIDAESLKDEGSRNKGGPGR